MIEAVSNVVTATVDSLKGSPALLVIVLLNALMLGLIAWQSKELRHQTYEEKRLILERCLPMISKGNS